MGQQASKAAKNISSRLSVAAKKHCTGSAIYRSQRPTLALRVEGPANKVMEVHTETMKKATSISRKQLDEAAHEKKNAQRSIPGHENC
jgi:hypothetical protein